MRVLVLLALVAFGAACVDVRQYPPLERNYITPVCDTHGCVARVYVDPNANGNGSGNSWADASPDLGHALGSLAERFDYSEEPTGTSPGIEIWLTGGEHHLGEGVLVLEDWGYTSLSFLGGFTGDETVATERDPTAPRSKLKRAGCDPAVQGSLAGGTLVIDRVEVTGEDSCSKFLDVSDTNTVTIRNSLFQGLAEAVLAGGAATVEGSTFVNNRLGLGLADWGSTAQVTDSRFTSNDIGLSVDGNVSVSQSTFNSNDIGLYLEGALTLSQSQLSANNIGALVRGGAVTVIGGEITNNTTGLQVDGTTRTVSLSNVTLDANDVGVDTEGATTLSQCTVTNHTGAGVRTGGSQLTVSGGHVNNNAVGLDARSGYISGASFSGNATGLLSAGGHMIVSNTIFTDNSTGMRAYNTLDVSNTSITGGSQGIIASGHLNLQSVTITAAVTASRVYDGVVANKCTFANNSTALSIRGGRARITESTFTGNTFGVSAPALPTELTFQTKVENSSFSDNDVAISHYASVKNEGFGLNVKGSSFSNNSVAVDADTGLYVEQGVFSGNTEHAIIGMGYLAVVSSQFINNTGPRGVAVAWFTSSLGGVIFGSTFTGNTAQTALGDTDYGGTVYQFLGSLAVVNSIFYNNTFTHTQGGTAAGAAIGVTGASLQVFNSVFWDNDADAGTAIAAVDSDGGVKAGVAVHSTTIQGWHGTDFYFQHTGSTLVTNTLQVVSGLICTPIPCPPVPGKPDANGRCHIAGGPCSGTYPSSCTTLTDCAGKGVAAKLPPDIFDLDNDGNTTEPLSRDIAGNPRVKGDLDPGAWEL